MPVDYYDRLTDGALPITIDSIKAYVKAPDDPDDDAELLRMLRAAVEAVEGEIDGSLRPQTWELYPACKLEAGDAICIAKRLVTDVAAISREVDGVEIAVAGTVYTLAHQPTSALVIEAYDEEWPDDADDRLRSVKVEFSTDIDPRYADEALHAVRRMVAHWYENRGDAELPGGSEWVKAAGVSRLLFPHRRPHA